MNGDESFKSMFLRVSHKDGLYHEKVDVRKTVKIIQIMGTTLHLWVTIII